MYLRPTQGPDVSTNEHLFKLSEEENVTPTQAIQAKIAQVEMELNSVVMERGDVIHGMLVGRCVNQHVLMVGEPGTGKTYLVRQFWSRIGGAKKYEIALTESTDPAKVFGPPDVKAMNEEGRMRTVTDGYMADCTECFLDEIFNANQPLLHEIMPPLNDAVFHNDGLVLPIPLRQVLAGTNQLNADVAVAATWDRLHIRYRVGYLLNRENMANMALSTVRLRTVNHGRGDNVNLPEDNKTVITLQEWDQARDEALALPISDEVLEAILDLREEIQKGDAGVHVSDRRFGEGLIAVCGNAYVRGRDRVTVADLDILADMWWNLLEQEKAVRAVVLAACNPHAREAMDLQDMLDGLKEEWNDVQAEDDTVKERIAVTIIGKLGQITKSEEGTGRADKVRREMLGNGDATHTIDAVINRTVDFRRTLSRVAFGIDETSFTGVGVS